MVKTLAGVGPVPPRRSSAMARAPSPLKPRRSLLAGKQGVLGYLSLRSLTKTRATHDLRPMEIRATMAALSRTAPSQFVPVAPEMLALASVAGAALTATETLQTLADSPQKLLRSGVDALLLDTVAGMAPRHLGQLKQAVKQLWDAGLDILLVGYDDSVISFDDLSDLVPRHTILDIYLGSLVRPPAADPVPRHDLPARRKPARRPRQRSA